MTGNQGARSRSSAWWRPALLMGALLSLAWLVAFGVTGMLWGRAGRASQGGLPPPPPAQVRAVDTGWVNLELYRRSNPQWHP